MRRLAFLSLILTLLTGLAWFLSRQGPPPAIEPLADLPPEAAAKIMIDGPKGSLILEKRGKAWRMTAPVSDWADGQAVEELLSGLRAFSIGSVIADNPADDGDFDLTPSSATRLRFFSKAGGPADLDGAFGKEALGYGSLYFRKAGEKAVHLATGVSSYRLNGAANDWRERKLLGGVDREAVSSIAIRAPSGRFTVAKSSEPLARDVFGLRAEDFVPAEPAKAAGLHRPFLLVEAGPTRLEIGGLRPEKGRAKPRYRYARVDGREGLFLVSVDDVDGIIKRLKP